MFSNDDQVNASRELATAVIEVSIDFQNRSFGIGGSLTEDERRSHYQTMMIHLSNITKVTGDKLKPEYKDGVKLCMAMLEMANELDLGSKAEDDAENNSRVANEFINGMLIKVTE